MLNREQLLPKINMAFDFAEVQLRNLIEAHPDQFPMYTTNGEWDFSGESWTNWCEGFLGGQLWLIYERNRDAGHIARKTISQAYDPEANMFLPDRFIKGTCPKCGGSVFRIGG